MTIYSLLGGGTETEEGGGDERKTAEKEELVKKSQNSWLQSYLNTFMCHQNNRLIVNVETANSTFALMTCRYQ